MQKIIIQNLDDLDKFAQTLYRHLNDYKVFTFEGPLGVGKTTLIQLILRKCGIEQPITSPTFTYVNVYENKKGQLFYHFDLYRISSLDQFLRAGFDEYLYLKNSWALIEWPEVIRPLLTKNICDVILEYAQNNQRLATLRCAELKY